MPKPTRKLIATAYHEAGHAVAAHVQGISIRRATIKAAGARLGAVEVANMPKAVRAALESGSITPAQRARIEADALIDFAGAVAEYQHRGRYSRIGSSADRDTIAAKLLRLSGDAREAHAYAAWLQQRAFNLIAVHWQAVEAVAQALLAHEALSGAAIAQLIAEVRDM